MSDLGWYGRTWHDRKQNEMLDSLSSQLASQESEARRLRSQLSQVQGNMEQRLSRLTTAFDAFVELTDLREELQAFQPEAVTRHRARRTLVRLVTSDRDAVDQAAMAGPPGPSPVDADSASGTPEGARDSSRNRHRSEMPGYWLPPALAGLLAMARHDDATAEAELAVARDADALRTNLFVCVALLLARRTDQAVGLLPPLFQLEPDQPVIRAQRELWLAACRGRFGAAGRQVVADRLAALVAGLPDGRRAEEIVAWRGLVDDLDVHIPVPSGFPKEPTDLLAPIRAAAQLTALAGWYEEAMVQPGPSADVPPAAPDQSPPDPLAATLQELVDEGAPQGRPLLERVAELRRVVSADGNTPSSPAPAPWDAGADAPLVLLLADARSTEPARRAVAAGAAGPLLAALADDLGAAAARPVPPQTEVQVGRHTIRFQSMGVDAATVAAAKAATVAPAPPSRDRMAQLGWTTIAVAGVVLLIGIVAGAAAFGVVVGAVAGGVGAWLLAEARRRASGAEAEQRRREADWERLEKRITAIEGAVAEIRARAERSTDEASTARARLDGLIATSAAPA